MEKETFIKRLVELRMGKGVSARDMSLSLGQSAGYINNIESGVNYPSMAVFFYICDFFGITPKELLEAIRGLNTEQVDTLISLAKNLKRQ